MSEQTVENVLVRLLRRGRLQPATAIDRIRSLGNGLTRMAVRDGLAELARANRITGVTIDGQVVGKIGWREVPVEVPDPSLLDWQRRVATNNALDADRRSALMMPPRHVLDLADDDKQALIDCLSRISAECSPGENNYVYSARGVMGSSKVLDAFPALAELLLGAAESGRVPRPLFAITAGPPKPSSVLFIENQSALASQLRAGFPPDQLAVCAFGYGLTIENLGRRLRDDSIIACPAAGERPDLSAIIASTPCFFWGDLDLEGLRIYEVLRGAIPHLQLAGIYTLMASLLIDRRKSHPYSTLFGSGKAGQRAPRGDTPEVLALARLCAERAIDQEAICPVLNLDLLVNPFSASR